jgi:glycine dehydrogenase subunit 1
VKKALVASGAWELPYAAPTFNEFVARRKQGAVAPLLAKLANDGILAGIDVSRFDRARDRDLLICVTERHARADLDRLVTALSQR